MPNTSIFIELTFEHEYRENATQKLFYRSVYIEINPKKNEESAIRA